jgi:hypothetical protein
VSAVRVEFCGEWYEVTEDRPFTIGRESDLVVDENPYLHRQFLQIYHESGFWWLANVGNVLAATVTDASGQVQAWLAPQAKLPVFFEVTLVLFTAGSTTYDFAIHNADKTFSSSATVKFNGGVTTLEPIPLTSSQRLLIVALSENALLQRIPGRVELPSSADAAERLGWTITTFNRKLDNVCDKLGRLGVLGLHGGRERLATDRRARLVEYAVSTRLVTPDDLPLLEGGA